MFRILLAAIVAALPISAMAQSPWGSGSPTYVARGAQLPAMNKIEYTTPAPLPALTVVPQPVLPTVKSASATPMSGSTLFAVDYTTPISTEVFAAEAPAPRVLGEEAAIVAAPVVDANWAPVTGCSDCFMGCCNIPKCAWVRYEQLAWSLSGGRLPPLVTTAPTSANVATAGAIGASGTRILFGDKEYLDDHRNGYRITAGGWLTEDRVLGIEASYFSIEGDSTRFAANSLRFPVLASSPFVNAVTGQSQRILMGYPGVVSGSTSVNYEQQRLYGLDLVARVMLSNQICGRLDGLVGYRQINFGESLAIRKNLIPNPNGPVGAVPGTTIQSDDIWDTNTNLYGMVVGLNWEVCYDKFYFSARPRVTIGQGESTVDRGGYTAIAVPGLPTERFPGGTYNLNSNLGRSSKKSWMCMPELDLQLGYNLCEQVRVFGGYSFIYLPQVARAGYQIDPAVNTDLIPPPLPTTGPQAPGAFVDRTSLFVSGVSVGVEIRY